MKDEGVYRTAPAIPGQEMTGFVLNMTGFVLNMIKYN